MIRFTRSVAAMSRQVIWETSDGLGIAGHLPEANPVQVLWCSWLCRYGVVDFHKNCEIYRPKGLDVSGVPIYYYRCPACGFIFTTAFDHFTKDDFLRYIYNEEYLLVDPDYQDVRPRANAGCVCNLFSAARPRRILDYGGGNGVLGGLASCRGFPSGGYLRPLCPSLLGTKPADRFDCVVSFEVVEHSTDPARVFADMNDFLTESGLILFSTLLQPADIDHQGLNWWYAAPRNGHVSLYDRESGAGCAALRVQARLIQ